MAEEDGMRPPAGTSWWTRTESADRLHQQNNEDADVYAESDDDGDSSPDGEDDEKSSEDSDSDDNRPLQQVRNAHLLAKGADLLNGMLEGEEGQTFPSKVWVDDASVWMHKKTVMKQAHDGSTLSNDRVQRARSAQDRAARASRVWNLREDLWSVRPGDNVAVLFQDPARAFIGRITRVRKKGKNRGWVEYRFPVALADRDELSAVYFQCYWYKRGRRRDQYIFDHADPAFYCVNTIICPASMTLVTAPNTYRLDRESAECMLRALRGYQYW